MKIEKGVLQRIDLASKLIGVVLVAIGIDKLRGASVSAGIFYIVLGGAISVIPEIMKKKMKIISREH